ERQPETVLAMALSPDQKQLALGRYDGVVVLLDVASGKVERQISGTPPPPKQEVKPKAVPPPKQAAMAAKKVTPQAGQRGRPLVVVVEGEGLDRVTEATLPQLTVAAKIGDKSA